MLVALAGLVGPGDTGPPMPTTTTTVSVPESPAAGLMLRATPPPSFSPKHEPSAPIGALPPAPTALAGLIAGMALLAARARRISFAEQRVRSALQDNVFSDVGYGDLRDISDLIGGLEKGEASAVVGALSDHELAVWLRELDGWRGGFSSRERRMLFADLVTRLRPRQLSRMIAMGKSVELIEAAVAGGAPGDNAELAMLLWRSRSPADPGWERIIDLVEASPGSTEAAVARRPLAGTVRSLLGIHRPIPDEPPRLRYDATVRFLTVAAGFSDPALKARLFVEIVEQHDTHRRLRRQGGAKPEHVLGGLFMLVRSDAHEVIARLNHAADPHANAFSEWIKDMIEADRIDELDVLLAEIAGGPDRLAFFADPGADPARPYANASNLGFYVGAYSLAIDGLVGDAEDRITLVGKLFSIFTGLVPGPDESVIRLPIGPLVDVHAAAVVKSLEEDATSLKQALWGLAKPRTADGQLWNGPGTTQFQDSWEEVMSVR